MLGNMNILWLFWELFYFPVSWPRILATDGMIDERR